MRCNLDHVANIAEGHEHGTSLEYYRFLSTAKGSCAELRSQLYLAFDLGCLDRSPFDDACTRTKRLGQLIGALGSSIGWHIDHQRSR